MKNRDFAPSLDRLRPELGYVKGNIAIISFRANRMKNDATLGEITKLKAWLEKQGGNMDEAARQQLTPEGPISGVDFDIPLTDSQKLSVTTIRLKKVNIEKQIADLQTQAARLDAFFYSELSRIATENKIDMQKNVLSDDLELKPKA